MPKGKKIVAVRADSAAYQAAIFNYCEETGKVLAIGADQDAAVKAAVTAIHAGDWKKFRDGEIAETVHCMNKTKKAFRLIVMRRPCDQDLFEEKSAHRYHVIASNRRGGPYVQGTRPDSRRAANVDVRKPPEIQS